MSEISILLITSDDTLLEFCQKHLSDTIIQKITLDNLSANTSALILIDCTTLTFDDCQQALEQCHDNTNIIALLDKIQLPDYGALMLNAGILMLQTPLDENGLRQIKQLHEKRRVDLTYYDAPDDDDIITYGYLAREFSQQSSNPEQMLQMIANAVRDSMHADLVVLVRMEGDKDTHYDIESLAISRSKIELEQYSTHDVIRSGGHTEYIVRTGLPIIIKDVTTFKLDDMDVNPQTIAWGFQSALGVPLMREKESFGAMWVLYRQKHPLALRELRHLQVHASHAALAYNYPLQKKLADQWQKAAQTIFARLDAHDSFEITLQNITDGIHESLDCDVVTLYVYHPEWEHFDQPYEKGARFPDALHEEETVLPDSIVYEVLQETEPQVIENVPRDSLFGQTNFAKREEILSSVALPLHRGIEVVGVVFINFRKERTFSADERQAISVLGGQIATSILNARLDEEGQQTIELANNLMQKATEQRDYIRSVMRFIDFERDLIHEDSSAILQTIARDTCKAAGADRVTIRLIVGDQEKALAKYSPHNETIVQDEIDADDVIRSDGHSQHIMHTNTRIVIPNIDLYDPKKYEGMKLNPNVVQRWKARVGLPLTSGRRSIGVMWISYKDARSFRPSQLQAFQSFANMAFFIKTQSIMQKRLRRALEILNEAHQTIAVDWVVDDILYHTMQLARKLVADSESSQHYRSHVALIEGGKQLVFYPKHNSPEIYTQLKTILSPDASIDLKPESPSIVVQAALQSKIQTVSDGSTNPHFLAVFTKKNQGSQVSLPIYVGGKLFAIISVEHPEADAFEWYDHATLEALASFIGQVIRNREQQQMRTALFESSHAITAGQDLQGLLATIAEQAHRVIGVKRRLHDHFAYVGLRQADETLEFLAAYPFSGSYSFDGSDYQSFNLQSEGKMGISGYAVKFNEAVLESDIQEHSHYLANFEIEEHRVASQLSIPIPDVTQNDRAIGVISLNHAEANIFDEGDLAFITLLAKLAAVAIRRARDIDAQKAHNESLSELANAAMHQVVKSHDFGNFRAVYMGNIRFIQDYIHDLQTHSKQILSNVDKDSYKILKTAISDLVPRIERIHSIYQQRIEQSTESPELGVRIKLAIRAWLDSSLQGDTQVQLELDESLKENIVCEIPAYWLREVTKILIGNASRAIEADENLDSSQRKIHIHAIYQQFDEGGQVQIRFSNHGQEIPEPIRQLLIRQVIPRSLREIYGGGRGIGLFMSGIILDAYQGNIEYQAKDEHTIFVLTLPAFGE